MCNHKSPSCPLLSCHLPDLATLPRSRCPCWGAMQSAAFSPGVWQLLRCGSRSHSCGVAADSILAVQQRIRLLQCGSRSHFCPVLYCHVSSLVSLSSFRPPCLGSTGRVCHTQAQRRYRLLQPVRQCSAPLPACTSFVVLADVCSAPSRGALGPVHTCTSCLKLKLLPVVYIQHVNFCTELCADCMVHAWGRLCKKDNHNHRVENSVYACILLMA